MESIHQEKAIRTQVSNPLPLRQKEPNRFSVSTVSFLAKASLDNLFSPPHVVTIYWHLAPFQVSRRADSGGPGSAAFRGSPPLRRP